MPETKLERNIAVLLPRIGHLLGGEYVEILAEAAARRARLDDVVDETAHRGRQRIAKLQEQKQSLNNKPTKRSNE